VSKTGTCDAARDPETHGLSYVDAAKGLYKAWHADEKDRAVQCASSVAVDGLFAIPLVTASFTGCPPVSGPPTALVTDCTFKATTPPGTLVMHEECDDITCGVTSISFNASKAPHIQGCDTRRDSHGRLSPEQIATGTYQAWRAGDEKVLGTCAFDQDLKDLKAHQPVDLIATGCANTQRSGIVGFITDCSFKHGTVPTYLVLSMDCAASAGCQLEGVKFTSGAK
jgi:hypothetical protein